MSVEDKKYRIAIIGGTGDFGSLFAKIFREEGHEVVITGRNREKGEKVAKAIGVNFTKDNVDAARKSDVIIISVPIEDTLKVIREVAPHVRSGKLLMDFTSVKIQPVRAMEEASNSGVGIIGTHPMFGPRVGSIEGQTVILTPIREGGWMKFLEGFFNKHRARLFVSTPEEHDRVMAVVQGLTHFAYITIASTIRNLDINVSESRRFASPVYELMLDFIARIVGQNPPLYAAIQMHNPFISEVHKVFVKEAEKLRERVEKEDVSGFVRIMSSSARIFSDVPGSIGKSDKAISALTHELKRLKESVGREVGLRQIYSGKVHAGSVISVDSDSVVIDNKGKKTRLNLSKIELLDENELLDWRKEKFGSEKTDLSFVFPDEVEESALAQTIKDSNNSIVACEVIDVFKGKQIPSGKKSITFRVESVGLEDPRVVEKFLSRLGGKLR